MTSLVAISVYIEELPYFPCMHDVLILCDIYSLPFVVTLFINLMPAHPKSQAATGCYKCLVFTVTFQSFVETITCATNP